MRLNALSKWLEGRRARAVRKPRRTVLGVTGFEDRRVPASLSGSVFQDLNNNGVRDGSEAGIAGVKVQLIGRTDDGKVVHTQVMTDASGNYTFDNLAAGKYMVMEKQPAGFRDGTDTAGSAGGTLRGRDLMAQIQLTACTTATGYNFGERPVAPRPSPDCNVPEKGNNGVGNGLDPQPPGNPPINDGAGTEPGSPGNRGGKKD